MRARMELGPPVLVPRVTNRRSLDAVWTWKFTSALPPSRGAALHKSADPSVPQFPRLYNMQERLRDPQKKSVYCTRYVLPLF